MEKENKDPLLHAIGIGKTFLSPSPLEVLKDITLEVYPGQSIAIKGASGKGKSTLLHILGTLEKPTEGKLFLFGNEIRGESIPRTRNQNIGFVFQSFNLLDHCTALQNVLFPAQIARKETSKGSIYYQRAMRLLEKVGLQERAHFTAKLLSGGEKQRVAIARALCNDPELILADEPTGNLDHHTSQKIHQLLLSCSKNLSKGLIIVTHDEELARHCDKIFHLRDGRLEPAHS